MSVLILFNMLRKSSAIKKKSFKKENFVSVDEVKVVREAEVFPSFTSPVDTSLCRVCLNEGIIPIFSTCNEENIAENLRIFGDIEIDEDDVFPKFLCGSCHSVLQAAVLWRQTAQNTEKALRRSQAVKNSDIDLSDVFENTIEESDDFNSTESWNEDKVVTKYECKSCLLEFPNLKDYYTHRKSLEHKKARAECPTCKKSVSALYLKFHILRQHEVGKQYICDVCGKTFSIQGSFCRHRLTHGIDLPFKCDRCPYRGRFKESLKMHMRTHTGERPYICTECPARFVSKSNLNKHSMTHKTEYDFHCEECNRGFYYEKKLLEHYKVDHGGIRDHVCNVCKKAFGYRKQLMKHQKKVHKRAKLRSGRLPLYLQLEMKDKTGIKPHTS